TAVVSTAGSVAGADALVSGGASAQSGATLTMVAGDTPPSITLDFGTDIGGLAFFDVSATTGSASLDIGYSEGKKWATPQGDMPRTDTFAVSGPGTFTSTTVQGGQRYEVITLTTPGSVTLTRVGVNYIADRTTADGYAGHFESSSDLLNRIWYDGAYTVQLDSVPTSSLPGAWTIGGGALSAHEGGVGLLNEGSGWTDYTMSFDAAIEKNQVGWMVRGQDANNGYLFILNSNDDTAGTPNMLQKYEMNNGSYVAFGSDPLPFDLATNSWHSIDTTVSGTSLSVSVDGQVVGGVDTSTLPPGAKAFATGTVGFRESNGETASLRNLEITDPEGATLYSNGLDSPSALADFAVPGTNTLPSMLDGGKRDRSIWTGDLNVQGPVVYYATNTTQYMKGSLALLGGQQLQSGFVTGALDPTTALNTGAPLPGTIGFYSASYSMYWVLALGAYDLYTGDAEFVKEQYPRVKAELAWNASRVDANGLLVTDSSDGRDWDAYDPAKTGEVAAYNMIYYKALLDGAQLATTAGDPSQASTYLQDAAGLKTAINTILLDQETGLYKISNVLTTGVAQDANALAILYGVAPESKSAAILAGLDTQLAGSEYGPLPFSADAGQSHNISPFASGYQLQAQLASNDTAGAQALLSTVWGNMVAPGDNYTGTMWEVINPVDGSPGFDNYTSLAHGWSAAPTSALSAYVLGIQPVGTGYSTWLVKPHAGDLAWTTGQAPTPHGPIAVDWSHDPSAGFAMHVEAPSQTSGTIAVPTFGKKIDIEVNGAKVWKDGVSIPGAGVSSATLTGEFVELSVTSGTFDISTGPSAVVPTAQSITFGAVGPKKLTDGAFTVSATASSGLPVTFTASGACTVDGSTVQPTHVGTCAITASQTGDSQFAPASLSRSFDIVPPGRGFHKPRRTPDHLEQNE
ncbi:MAG TPA: alpha-L-rhamnosidase C-terminal domain-containing protein, partial [Microbacteriaceae bacterium]|nr:alpha-L-rhamnosidase C-terminal domain-containing protein [Microbacteriaceae bacterium]